MADSKVSQLPTLSTPAADDLLLVVDNVGVEPTSKKLTLGDLFARVPGPMVVNYDVTATGNTALNVTRTNQLTVAGDRLEIQQSYTPVTPVGSDGDKRGDWSYDVDYVYVCVNDYDGASDIWKRSPLTSW